MGPQLVLTKKPPWFAQHHHSLPPHPRDLLFLTPDHLLHHRHPTILPTLQHPHQSICCHQSQLDLPPVQGARSPYCDQRYVLVPSPLHHRQFG